MQTWLALIVVAVGLVPARDCGPFCLHERHGDAPAPEPARGAIRDGCDTGAAVGRRDRAGAAGRPRALASRTSRESRWRSAPASDILWAEGFGWADLEKRVPVAPQMRFRIGTASTALTSAAVGLLLEKNRLKLDDEIQTYVPEFPDKQWPVTLRQLMAHVAGLKSDGGDEGPLFSEHCERPVDALQYFKSSPLLFQPGTRYLYSRYGWILVSAAVETAADQPFLSFMRRQIFQPLGMDHTEADSATEPIAERATFYFPEVRGGSSLRPGPDAPARLFLLRGSPAYSCPPVRPGAVRDGDQQRQAAATRHRPIAPDLTAAVLGRRDGYGLGWDLETVALGAQQTSSVGHDGGLVGRNGGVSHDVPRARDRRVRDVEHFLRGHVWSWCENRAGLRRTRQNSSSKVIRAPTVVRELLLTETGNPLPA
jgi:CubicO group peptidase (beta-lactamase class C family)